MEKQFNEIYEDMKKIDIYKDPIEQAYHLKKFSELFRRVVNDEKCLSEVFTFLNKHALKDSRFAVNMSAVFASRQLDEVVVQNGKLRNAMLGVLQQNFQNIEQMKKDDMQEFYNSVTLLGEYYNRKKFTNGKRIHILGQSLLLLLTTELEGAIKKCLADDNDGIRPEFAKLILSQITLNGVDAKTDHKQEITDLMFTIRKCLINVPSLEESVKAFLLMTLDLYYSNFNLVGDLLNNLYGKYLLDGDNNGGNPTNNDKKDKSPNNNQNKNSNSKSASDDKNSETSPKILSPNCDKENQQENGITPNKTPPKKDKSKEKEKEKEEEKTEKDTNVTKSIINDDKNDKNSDSTSGSRPTLNGGSVNVLKQNGNSQSNLPYKNSVKTKAEAVPSIKAQHKEDDAENLTCDEQSFEDDASPQKVNPYSNSFLNFLANN